MSADFSNETWWSFPLDILEMSTIVWIFNAAFLISNVQWNSLIFINIYDAQCEANLFFGKWIIC